MARRKNGSAGGLLVAALAVAAAAIFSSQHDTLPPMVVHGPAESSTTTTIASPDASTTITSADTPQAEMHPEQQIDAAPTTTMWVKGSKVALRDGAGKSFVIVDRLNAGRAVELIRAGGDWSFVRTR